MRKTDDKPKTYFRSKGRVFQINDGWWFATREGDRGPYPSKKEAAEELAAYVLEVRGNIDLNEISIYDKDEEDRSVWDGRER